MEFGMKIYTTSLGETCEFRCIRFEECRDSGIGTPFRVRISFSVFVTERAIGEREGSRKKAGSGSKKEGVERTA